ncbi:cuticle protein CP14.6-like [Panulirus ornatus]|uniref:cuticle protein CP14.6-like n=1 Tax=Panulirus ornatus TaxID=150431 RepID=UPI003A86B50E
MQSSRAPSNMKFVVLSMLVAVASASSLYEAPSARHDSLEVVPILKHEFNADDDGNYNLEVETGNNIAVSGSGSASGPDGSVVVAGQYSYVAPDGTDVVVKYVADENGYQPQSDLLPVAPEFPHEIPQFVLDQIAFAAEEDARRAREGPSKRYDAP